MSNPSACGKRKREQEAFPQVTDTAGRGGCSRGDIDATVEEVIDCEQE